MIAGYLDICRDPLKGIDRIIRGHNSKYNSTTVRNKFIDDKFIKSVDTLIESQVDYDEWHEKLCESIICFYQQYGYNDMTFGKAQKWINMSMKYIMLYTINYQQSLKRYESVFHVPIDRYIAPCIAELVGFLPNDNGKGRLENLDKTFNAQNYTWSNIIDYGAYLECQKGIREELNEPPIKWEFREWKAQKDALENKELLKLLISFDNRGNNEDINQASKIIQSHLSHC